MRVSQGGIGLIQGWEKCRLVAYKPTPADRWTIGWGTTVYPSGQPVRQNETCTQESADSWFLINLVKYENGVDGLTNDNISQANFDGLVSFTYNVGIDAYRRCTLRQIVNQNPNFVSIRPHFMAWHFQASKPLLGLWRRRHAEADFYFSVHTAEPPAPWIP